MRRDNLERIEIREEKKEILEEKDINNIILIKIYRYPNYICGIKLFETKELIGIFYNPVDYVLDGILIINKKYIKHFSEDNTEKLKIKILAKKIKDYKIDFISNLEISDIRSIIYELHKKNNIIEIGLENQSYSLIGKILNINVKSFVINLLSTNADFLYNQRIKFDKVRMISINTDYLNSLSMVLE